MKLKPMIPIEKLFPKFDEGLDQIYDELFNDEHAIELRYFLNSKGCHDYKPNIKEGRYLDEIRVITNKDMSPRFTTDMLELYGLVLYETKVLGKDYHKYYFKHHSHCNLD